MRTAASGELRVLVVGAGLAGAAITAGLRAQGARVDWLELRTDEGDVGAGILLTGNAFAALDRLGLGDRVRAVGRPVRRVRFTDHRHRDLFHVDVEGRRPPWPAFACLHRAALRRALLDATAPPSPRWGVTIDRLDADTGAVQQSDGARARYDLVVGADGVHSRVRRLVFEAPPAAPIDGFAGWRFVARRPRGLEDPLYMLGDGRTLLLHPLPHDEVYCGAGPADVALPLPSGEPAHRQLRALFADFAGPARELLESVDETTVLIPSRYWNVAHEPWHRGRCVLSGDAAHACAPTLAQGGAMAFEDAAALCDALAGEADVPAALARFEARRRPRVAAVQRESLERMEANRLLGPERFAQRNAILCKLGGRRLEAVWGSLMEPGAW